MSDLLIASGPWAGTRVPLGEGLEIGRSAACRIRIHDDRASRVHARLVVREGEVLLEDLGSRNGTLLNGEPATGCSHLHPGDRIRIGRTYFVFDPDVQLLPARFSGGLLLLDDAITVLETKQPMRERPGRRWEEDLAAAGRRLQATTDPASVAQVLAEEILRVLRARGVAVIEGAGGLSEGVSPLVILGLSEIALPGALLREVQVAGKIIEVLVDRASSAALEAMGAAQTSGARLVLVPLPDSRGQRGVIVAELSADASTHREAPAIVALAAIGGTALAGAERCDRLMLHASFHLRKIDPTAPVVLGDSEVFERCTRELLQAAASGRSLRLVGEAGTGRTLLACYAHQKGPGREAPLALYDPVFPDPDPALLFGAEGRDDIERGFESGMLERARGGTCVVRAFSCLPRVMQVRLLDALEREVIVREGGQRPVDLRTRIILIDDEETRPARAIRRRMKGLGITTVKVPALRDRGLDVELLLECCLQDAARALGRQPPLVPDEVRGTIASQRWSGNLLELAAFSEAVLIATPPGAAFVIPATWAKGVRHGRGEGLFEQVAALEADTIRTAMEAENGGKARAARRLGISRPTLDRKLRRYGL